MTERMPAIFFGHGNPMNAIQSNRYTQAWSAIGAALPRPRAVLAVSAHWHIPGTHVTAMRTPRTIHDFGGFPQELFEVQYPAPGDPELAARAAALLEPISVSLDASWGLDHGVWSVLCHVFPNADVPIVQLSIDKTQPASFHYEVGEHLAPLRDEGVFIMGSGNIVHNLHAYAWRQSAVEPLDWAVRFDDHVREFLRLQDHEALIKYETLGDDAMLSVPTPEHFLPLLYVAALQGTDENVSFPVEGFDGGSISMLTVSIT